MGKINFTHRHKDNWQVKLNGLSHHLTPQATHFILFISLTRPKELYIMLPRKSVFLNYRNKDTVYYSNGQEITDLILCRTLHPNGKARRIPETFNLLWEFYMGWDSWGDWKAPFMVYYSSIVSFNFDLSAVSIFISNNIAWRMPVEEYFASRVPCDWIKVDVLDLLLKTILDIDKKKLGSTTLWKYARERIVTTNSFTTMFWNYFLLFEVFQKHLKLCLLVKLKS